MTVFGDTRADMAAKLVAAGLDRATTDPAALVPYVLVGPVTVLGAQGVGGWSATVDVVVAVPKPGDAAALDQLELALQAVLVTLGAAPAVPTTVGDTDLPAYVVTYPLNLTNPNC